MIWVDLLSALGMAFVDFLRDKYFKRSTSEEVWAERILKYAVAPIYGGGQLSALLTGMIKNKGNLGKAMASREFGRSVDNILVGYVKDASKAIVKAGGIPSDIKSGYYRDALNKTFKTVDVLQRGITGLSTGNFYKYFMKQPAQWIKDGFKGDDSLWGSALREANYNPYMRDTFTAKEYSDAGQEISTKYRFKKEVKDDIMANAKANANDAFDIDVYNELPNKAVDGKVQRVHTGAGKVKDISTKKEYLKEIWKTATNTYIKDMGLKKYNLDETSVKSK
jgi:hypothetical protein